VNDGIEKGLCSKQYVTVDHTVAVVRSFYLSGIRHMHVTLGNPEQDCHMAFQYYNKPCTVCSLAEQEAGWNSTYPSSNNPKATTQYKESVRETCWEL